MTREEKKAIREAKTEAMKQAKIEAKKEKQESTAFARSIEKWKAKDAWIECTNQ